MKFRLTIAYDGTDYVGWQIQPNGTSIQGLIEGALSTLLGHPTRIVGAGRTDAGVHALAQVAHFETDKDIPLHALLYGLNGLLPGAIRVTECEGVDPSFHAQRSAQRKTYHYHLWLKRPLDPFVGRFRYAPPLPLSVSLLREAAAYFVGERDFATFANLGSSAKTSVRRLYRLDVIEQEGGVRMEFEGNGFLYKMVRNIVGVLLEVASGRRAIEELPGLFAAKDRRQGGVAAPARGLFLVKVDY